MNTFGTEVDPVEQVANAVPRAGSVKSGDNRMIGGNLRIGSRCSQEGQLQRPEFPPVQYQRGKVDVQGFQNSLDVANGLIRVPAVVDVDSEWPQSQLLGFDRNEARVHTATH